MAIGALFAVPELQADGPARLEGTSPGYVQLRFLASGATMTQEAKRVVRYCLMPGTRVEVTTTAGQLSAVISEQAPVQPSRGALVRYQVITSDGDELDIDEGAITSVIAETDPAEQLRTVAFHELRPRFGHGTTPRDPEPWGAQTWSARQSVLAWSAEAWADTGGVVGLAGARVEPLPHQVLCARRVLADRQVRFLLADEVGLGKTIEAGLVMQSLLAMEPDLRVLVIAPGTLVGQWFLELHVRFGGRRFLMLDAERMAEHAGDPWQEPRVIASARALEELSGRDSLRFAKAKWDLVIVDECHRMAPGGPLYKRVASLSKRAPHVLLLSATPPTDHAEAWLALLHLLQPDSYPLDDHAGFADKLAAASEIEQLLRQTRQAETATACKSLAKAWAKALPHDPDAVGLAKAWAAAKADARPAALAALQTWVREHHRLDHRVIRNRRAVLAELAATTGVAPLPLASRAYEAIDYTVDKSEAAVREALQQYQDAVIAGAGGAAAVGPRAQHWLLQLHLALAAHPAVLERLLAMRAAVVEDPEEFDEYRAGARRGEGLGDVLRADLSDAEAMRHLAVSAACVDEPDAELAELAALQQAVADWKRRVPARTRALLERLEAFWAEHPQEKVLIFTGHAAGVEAIASFLAARLGGEHVRRFGAHIDPLEREEEARRFQRDDASWVLVSDALGGEGRNFQFASVVAHHDLPWSIAAVEQRVGRVDRLGRDGEVPSWVLAPAADDALDGAWAELVGRAIGVFNASISGLEFLATELETSALTTGLIDGAAALRGQIDAIAERVASERSRVDAEADELQRAGEDEFRAAAKLAQRVSRTRSPVSALCHWLRGMGGGVKRDDDGPRAFHLRERAADDPEGGVFEREPALRHPQLAFFARGHDLIDRLVRDAEQASWCAANAWRRGPSPTCKRWEGVRVELAVAPDPIPLVTAGLPLAALRRVLGTAPPRHEVRFVRADGSVEDDPQVLAHLEPRFDSRKGDKALSQRASRETWMRPAMSGSISTVLDWQTTVATATATAGDLAETLSASAAADATAAVTPVLQAAQSLAERRAASAVATLGPEHPDAERLQAEAEAEASAVAALAEAVAGTSARVVGVAYVVVA